MIAVSQLRPSVRSFLTALVLVIAAADWAIAGTVSHSGRVVAVDPQAGTMVFEEVGPSGVEDAAPTVTRHRIAVLSSTMFVRARRVAGPGSAGWSGDFVEELVESWSVEQGNFVTILCLHEGRFLTALEIIVTVVDR